jgi:hypothetical protein
MYDPVVQLLFVLVVAAGGRPQPPTQSQQQRLVGRSHGCHRLFSSQLFFPFLTYSGLSSQQMQAQVGGSYRRQRDKEASKDDEGGLTPGNLLSSVLCDDRFSCLEL